MFSQKGFDRFLCKFELRRNVDPGFCLPREAPINVSSHYRHLFSFWISQEDNFYVVCLEIMPGTPFLGIWYSEFGMQWQLFSMLLSLCQLGNKICPFSVLTTFRCIEKFLVHVAKIIGNTLSKLKKPESGFFFNSVKFWDY